MGRHNSPLAMHQCDFRVVHLTWTAFAAQLAHRLSHREHRPRLPRMAMREQSAMCINWQFAAKFDPPVLNEASALAFRTKAQILAFDYHHWCEAVVQFRDVDVSWPEPRHRVRALTRFFRRGGR